MNIYLIGFMGSGKSTIGKILAKNLNFFFLDLDNYIEQQCNCSISDIFEQKGEFVFRKLESDNLIERTQKDNQVISCGGGTPCFNNNINIMNTNGITVYIHLGEAALFNRLKNAKGNRPLIANKTDDELKKLISDLIIKRESDYNKCKLIVNGANLKSNSNIEKLVKLIKEV